jgi:hypothetical protein
MHTIMVIVGGFLMLGLCLVAGRVIGAPVGKRWLLLSKSSY